MEKVKHYEYFPDAAYTDFEFIINHLTDSLNIEENYSDSQERPYKDKCMLWCNASFYSNRNSSSDVSLSLNVILKIYQGKEYYQICFWYVFWLSLRSTLRNVLVWSKYATINETTKCFTQTKSMTHCEKNEQWLKTTNKSKLLLLWKEIGFNYSRSKLSCA